MIRADQPGRFQGRMHAKARPSPCVASRQAASRIICRLLPRARPIGVTGQRCAASRSVHRRRRGWCGPGHMPPGHEPCRRGRRAKLAAVVAWWLDLGQTLAGRSAVTACWLALPAVLPRLAALPRSGWRYRWHTVLTGSWSGHARHSGKSCWQWLAQPTSRY